MKLEITFKRNNCTVVWLVGCRFQVQLSHEVPGTIGGLSSVDVFLRDPHLCEFQLCGRKSNFLGAVDITFNCKAYIIGQNIGTKVKNYTQ